MKVTDSAAIRNDQVARNRARYRGPDYPGNTPGWWPSFVIEAEPVVAETEEPE